MDFQTPDIVVNENTGSAQVCVERNTTTAVPMSVDVTTSFGSASGKGTTFNCTICTNRFIVFCFYLQRMIWSR